MRKMTITEALVKILEDKHWMRKVFLGGLMLCMPILAAFAKGYLLLVFRACIRGNETKGLPSWKAGQSFILGLKGFVIALAYYVFPALAIWGAHVTYKTGGFHIFLTIAIVLTSLATVFLPWAVANWLSTGFMKSAFQIRRLFRVFGFFGEYLGVFIRCFLLVLFATGTAFAGFFALLAAAQLMGETTGKYIPNAEDKLANNPLES